MLLDDQYVVVSNMILPPLLQELSWNYCLHRPSGQVLPSPVAGAFVELPAPGFSEVGDRRELGLDQLPGIVSPGQILQRPLRVLLAVILYVKVSDHVIRDVVHHNHVLDLAKISHLVEHLAVEI